MIFTATHMRHLLIATGVLLLPFASTPTRAADPTADIAAFNKAYDAAILSRDDARVLAVWASDGVSLLPEQEPIRGRAAMAAFLARVQAQTPGWKVIAQESTCHDIVVHDDWASEWCETHQVASRPGGQSNWEGWGKMALVLEKQHGRWMIRQEMWNQGVARAAAK
jgi:ketosteroid isomerase-like protein